MSVSINGTSGLVFNDASTQNTAATGFGFKNRIINGAMMVSQRGTSATVNSSSQFYTPDRFFGQGTNTAGVFTTTQSSTAPSNYKNSVAIAVTTADNALGASGFYTFGQFIEGYNVTDLGWGTATASTVTLSFWVKSNLTGTFGGSLANNAFNRSYPFTYTISAANTWEQKFVIIAGDTTGTWATDNTTGIRLYFGLGMGSSFSGTAGTWAGVGYCSATGATNVMSSTSNNWSITGVQLEKGSTATSFDYRPYGTELALCQRYFQQKVTVVSTTTQYVTTHFLAPMRTGPTNTPSFDGGTGATFALFGYGNAIGSIYQNQNHSQLATAAINLSAEL